MRASEAPNSWSFHTDASWPFFFWRRGSLTAYLRKLVALGIKLLCPNVVALVSFLTVQKLRKLHHFWTDLELVDMGTPMQWPGHKQNFVNGVIGTYFS